METIIFDGKELAGKIEADLKERIMELGRKPTLAIVLDNDTEASKKYVQMKQQKAEELGIDVQVFKKLSEVNQAEFDGVMVQLPSNEDLSMIDPEKDVDGLNSEWSPAPGESIRSPRGSLSSFVPATVKAIEKILDQALLFTDADVDDKLTIAVVGVKGKVGAPLVERMKMYGMNVGGFDLDDELNLKNFKVVISCTGKPGLIKEEMVRGGVIVIDVGYPKGDFDEKVKDKAIFWTPVPGGVGPMTVFCLLENLVKAC